MSKIGKKRERTAGKNSNDFTYLCRIIYLPLHVKITTHKITTYRRLRYTHMLYNRCFWIVRLFYDERKFFGVYKFIECS